MASAAATDKGKQATGKFRSQSERRSTLQVPYMRMRFSEKRSTRLLMRWLNFRVDLLDDDGNKMEVKTGKEISAEVSRLCQLAKEADEKEEQRRRLAPLKELVLRKLVPGITITRAELKRKLQGTLEIDMANLQLVLDQVAEEVQMATPTGRRRPRKLFRLKAGIHSSADKE